MTIRRITPKTKEEWRKSLLGYLNAVFDDNPDPELQNKFAAFGNIVSGYIIEDREKAELLAAEQVRSEIGEYVESKRSRMFRPRDPGTI